MRNMAAVAFLLVLCAGVSAEEELAHSKEPLKDIKKAVAEGKAAIIDVREVDEWEDEHLKDARFVPLSQLKKSEKVPDGVPKDKPVYVHCAVGARALTAAKIMKKLGYDPRPITASPDELIAAGFEAAKKAGK